MTTSSAMKMALLLDSATAPALWPSVVWKTLSAGSLLSNQAIPMLPSTMALCV